MHSRRWPDWVWHYGGRVIVVEIAVAVLLYAGTQWPTVLVAMVAVGIAWHFGGQQAELQRMYQRFACMPVLTARHTADPNVVEIHAIGNGPAMDIRATVLTVQSWRSVPGQSYMATAVECTADHLAPRDVCLAKAIERGGVTSSWQDEAGRDIPLVGSFDVWIIHSADLMGVHSHLVSAPHESGPPTYQDEQWRWWYGQQSPGWVRQHCIRCQNLARWEERGRRVGWLKGVSAAWRARLQKKTSEEWPSPDAQARDRAR